MLRECVNSIVGEGDREIVINFKLLLDKVVLGDDVAELWCDHVDDLLLMETDTGWCDNDSEEECVAVLDWLNVLLKVAEGMVLLVSSSV